jgi:hypothetical protein
VGLDLDDDAVAGKAELWVLGIDEQALFALSLR